MFSRLRSVLILWLGLASASTLAAQSVCRPADTTTAILTLDLGRLSSATSGGDLVSRNALHLPLVQPSQFVVVTQEAVCKKANASYQAHLATSGGTAFSGKVYVLQIGNVYAVQDPVYRYRAGQNYPLTLIMDSHYKVLSGY